MDETRKERKWPPEEQRFLEHLLALGIIEEIRPPLPPEGIREEHEPIPIEGRPISEEIIEARR